MKRVLTILLLVSFVMALAPPCHAAGYGEIAISLVDVPAELQERSVLITLGSGPNDTDTILVVLNGLNQYCQTVTLSEGIYYCNAAVQYDALNDWPLREVDGTTFLQVEAGGQYELQYEFAGESWFTEVTGQTRYYTPLPLRQPPADYLPEAAQISAYLTAPTVSSTCRTCTAVQYTRWMYMNPINWPPFARRLTADCMRFYLPALWAMQRNATSSNVSRRNSIPMTAQAFT